MKKLILMRHADTNSPEPGQRDKDRTLTERGRQAAAQMGTWLQENAHVPQAAMISSAVRTRQTWERMAITCDTQFLDHLYLAEANEYLAAAQTAPDCDCLLVLGHNPGMETAMGHMAGRRMSAPTAAIAVYTLPISQWRDAEFKLGSLEAFETPKPLT